MAKKHKTPGKVAAKTPKPEKGLLPGVKKKRTASIPKMSGY